MDADADHRDCKACGPCSPLAETCLFFPFIAGSCCKAFDYDSAMMDKVGWDNCVYCCCTSPLLDDDATGDERCQAILFFPCLWAPTCIVTSVLCGPCIAWTAYTHQGERAERRRMKASGAQEPDEKARRVHTWAELLQIAEADRDELEQVVLFAHGEPNVERALDKRALPWLCYVLAAGSSGQRQVAQGALVAYLAKTYGVQADAWQEGGDLRGALGSPTVAKKLTEALRPGARDLVWRLAAGAADEFEKKLMVLLLLPDPSFQEARGQAEALLAWALDASAPDVQAAACRALARLAAAYRQAGVLGAPSPRVVDALIKAAWRAPADTRSVAVVTLRELCCCSPAVRQAATRTMAALAACVSRGPAGPHFNARGACQAPARELKRHTFFAGMKPPLECDLSAVAAVSGGLTGTAGPLCNARDACQALAFEPTCRTILAGMNPPLEYDLPAVAAVSACGLTGTAPDKDGFRGVPYWFLKAKKIRSWQDGDPPPPRYQDLMKRGDWLEEVLVSPHACFDGYYRQTMLVVSHRWEDPEHPDPASTQLKILRKFVCEHPCIEYVWLDWYCMPQGDDRTEKEKAYFQLALTNINILYLGLTVLAIYDSSYMSRFWCMFEAWCAMRLTSAEGLSVPPPAERRLHVRCAGATADEADSHVEHLFKVLENKTAAQLRDMLGMDDIKVTNQGDRTTQLQKLAGIEQLVKQVCAAKLVLLLSLDDTELLPVLQASEKLWKTAAPNVIGQRETE